MTPVYVTAIIGQINQGRIQAANLYLRSWATFWRLSANSIGPQGRPITFQPDPTIPFGPQDQILHFGPLAQWFLGYAATAQATLAQQSPDLTIPAVPTGYRFGGSDGTATYPSDGTAFLQQTSDGGTTWALVPLSAAGIAQATACGIAIPAALQPH